MENRGRLYVVSTPIGNLDDITLRALKVLKEVDFIISEKPEKTLRLLNHHKIRKPIFPFFQRTDERRLSVLIERIKKGEQAAVVVEAGTPGVSDPGENLIRMAIEREVEVLSVPGPSAVTSAISISGAPSGKGFVFLGFPPHKKGRRKFFESLRNYELTCVLFESPHRLRRTLSDLARFASDFKICVVKEMTKLHEKCYRGKVEEVMRILQEEEIKGEFTIVIWKEKRQD